MRCGQPDGSERPSHHRTAYTQLAALGPGQIATSRCASQLPRSSIACTSHVSRSASLALSSSLLCLFSSERLVVHGEFDSEEFSGCVTIVRLPSRCRRDQRSVLA